MNETLVTENPTQTTFKSQLINARMDEMAAREKILAGLRSLHIGPRAMKLFCESELVYYQPETREILGLLGLILTSEALTSDNPVVRVKIEKLRTWRRARARDKGVPAFRILTNRVLLAMAETTPENRESLEKLKGFGRISADAYGTELIDLLRD